MESTTTTATQKQKPSLASKELQQRMAALDMVLVGHANAKQSAEKEVETAKVRLAEVQELISQMAARVNVLQRIRFEYQSELDARLADE